MAHRSVVRRTLWLTLAGCLLLQQLPAQPGFLPPSDTYRPDRLRKVVLAETALFTVTSVGLYFLWYKKFPKSRFHLLNDNREWFQVDKIGHATTAYTLATMQHDLLRWSGVRPGPAILTSALSSVAYMSIIEVMDGFSRDWGFSTGDMLANLGGAALFAAQQYGWGEQRIGLKVSARFSPYAAYNPALLGKHWSSRLMKDYNGQTYWLSFNLRSFLPADSRFPAWANLALGYGADGMTGASANPTQLKGRELPSFTRSRQFYLAADADLYRIAMPRAVETPLYLLQFVKIPAPGIEINSKRKVTFRPLQF
ncbi:MAG TPA: DUF2279 domain-containing protein [Lacibacter sp.]|nr:DUF2279 domain-containing protein [Lacibacter sp.]HMO89185.1 DUF2279 domain-containing protein [Lacibacter sp.]HMP86480.1 DUF2279 domain-containing protein [Lacibacter sp.]